MNSRRAFNAVLAILCSLLLGLAAGAVWTAILLYAGATPIQLAWIALPTGALLGLLLRTCVNQPGRTTAILAFVATVLAALYMEALYASLQLSWMIGLDVVEAIRTAGFGMLLSVGRLALTHSSECWWTLGAAMLSAWIAIRPARRDRPGKAPLKLNRRAP